MTDMQHGGKDHAENWIVTKKDNVFKHANSEVCMHIGKWILPDLSPVEEDFRIAVEIPSPSGLLRKSSCKCI